MNYWVLAFVGDDAQQNLETTRGTNVPAGIRSSSGYHEPTAVQWCRGKET